MIIDENKVYNCNYIQTNVMFLILTYRFLHKSYLQKLLEITYSLLLFVSKYAIFMRLNIDLFH